MRTAILTLAFAVLTALVDSSPLPQDAPPAPGGAPPAPGGAPPAGGEKKIVVVGPGKGPWAVGSEQVATWWSTGFTADEPVSVETHAKDSTTPVSSTDSTLNAGNVPIKIDDKYTPGTEYETVVSLKSDPSIKGVGPAFTVTGGGGGPAPAAPGPGGPPPPSGPPPPPGGPPEGSPPPPGGPPEGSPPPPGGPPEGSPPPPGGPPGGSPSPEGTKGPEPKGPPPPEPKGPPPPGGETAPKR